MLSVLKQHEIDRHPPPRAAMPETWRGVLNTLRVIALDCRVAARTDLFEACALISSQRAKSQEAFAEALFLCMGDTMRRKPVFFQPGTDEFSFDEAWLLRALAAAQSNDGDSLSFLIRSRVQTIHQRHIAFLIKGISDQFTLV